MCKKSDEIAKKKIISHLKAGKKRQHIINITCPSVMEPSVTGKVTFR